MSTMSTQEKIRSEVEKLKDTVRNLSRIPGTKDEMKKLQFIIEHLQAKIRRENEYEIKELLPSWNSITNAEVAKIKSCLFTPPHLTGSIASELFYNLFLNGVHENGKEKIYKPEQKDHVIYMRADLTGAYTPMEHTHGYTQCFALVPTVSEGREYTDIIGQVRDIIFGMGYNIDSLTHRDESIQMRSSKQMCHTYEGDGVFITCNIGEEQERSYVTIFPLKNTGQTEPKLSSEITSMFTNEKFRGACN